MKRFFFLSIYLVMILAPSCKNQLSETEIAEQQKLYETAIKSVNQRNFIVLADEFSYLNRKAFTVMPKDNYVLLDGNSADIKISLNMPNTASPTEFDDYSATAHNLEMKTDKQGNITVKMLVKGVTLDAAVTIVIEKGTNKCTAQISPNVGTEMMLYGKILELDTVREYINLKKKEEEKNKE